MDIDFSKINLEYLVYVRDLAKEDIEVMALLLGIPEDLARILAAVKPEEMVRVIEIKIPLLIPRHEPWWWQRLFEAIREGRTDELKAIIEHASLMSAPPVKRD
jgi:hypothetical protein